MVTDALFVVIDALFVVIDALIVVRSARTMVSAGVTNRFCGLCFGLCARIVGWCARIDHCCDGTVLRGSGIDRSPGLIDVIGGGTVVTANGIIVRGDRTMAIGGVTRN